MKATSMNMPWIAPLRSISAAAAALLLMFGLFSGTAHAQLRTIPPTAIPASMDIGLYPNIRLNGKDARLAPGARVYDTNNLIVTPASLSGSYPVRFELEPGGEVIRAWILTAEEYAALGRDAPKRGGGNGGPSGPIFSSPKY